MGFHTISSTFGLAVAMQLIGAAAATRWFPETVPAAMLQLLQLAVLADFGLYWGRWLLQKLIQWHHTRHILLVSMLHACVDT